MNLLIVSLLFSFIATQQQCILGQNCPYNQGICVEGKCQCQDGFKNYFDPKLTQEQQIYCNYKQKDHYTALLLEFFLPGIGHIYAYKYWFGAIKIILLLSFVCSSYYIYHQIRVPSFILALKASILNKIKENLSNNRNITLLDIAQFIFNISFYPFWIFWVFDLYMYFTKTYYDGYGIPLF